MKLFVALLAVAALLLAGCTGSDLKTPSQDASGDYIIHMTAGNKFSPMNAKVPTGATVAWVHDGGPAHDVTAENGDWSSDDPVSEGGFGSKMGSGDRYERTFTEPGTYEYLCHVHGDQMKGKLVVQGEPASGTTLSGDSSDTGAPDA